MVAVGPRPKVLGSSMRQLCLQAFPRSDPKNPAQIQSPVSILLLGAAGARLVWPSTRCRGLPRRLVRPSTLWPLAGDLLEPAPEISSRSWSGHLFLAPACAASGRAAALESSSDPPHPASVRLVAGLGQVRPVLPGCLGDGRSSLEVTGSPSCLSQPSTCSGCAAGAGDVHGYAMAAMAVMCCPTWGAVVAGC
jgi:hypothetical protein